MQCYLNIDCPWQPFYHKSEPSATAVEDFHVLQNPNKGITEGVLENSCRAKQSNTMHQIQRHTIQWRTM